MNTKLTLSLNAQVIEEAKKYAARKQTSISAMVENYFRSLTSRKKKRYVADELAGIMNEKKLRSLNDPRINHYLDK